MLEIPSVPCVENSPLEINILRPQAILHVLAILVALCNWVEIYK